jgi:nucleotide-binding universal stress UspA family protein
MPYKPAVVTISPARRGEAMFKRITCGVDESPEALEAVRQARQLAHPDAELLLVGVVDEAAAVHAGWAATAVLEDMREAEVAALTAARGEATGGHAETRLLRGVPWSSIAAAAYEERADLVAVGTHNRWRPAGIVGGSVATYVLHEAPCSVLIARPCGDPEQFPRSIVVGFDGSGCAMEALAVASRLAEETSADLRVVAAAGGEKLPLDPIREHAPDAALDHRPPVDALVAESETADLLVLGSRGLHGFAAVGSVSERVAHQAKSSVLVIRANRAVRSSP